MDPTSAPAATDEPRFDVTVRMPPGRRLEEVAQLAQAAGIRPDRIEALLGVLKNGPSAKIGAAVPRDRADKAREQFTRAGLSVDVTPVLALTAMMTGQFDARIECPACDQKILLPENRQCPHCGVFVDKVTEDVILRKKLREKEKLALEFRAARDKQQAEKTARESLEARLRDEIRKELEEEYGLAEQKRPALRPGVLAAAAVLLVALAFVVGRGSSGGFTMAALAGTAPPPAAPGKLDPQQLLEKIDAGAPLGGNTADAAAAHGGPLAGDPDIDDPLVQAAGGKRIGAKGISIEQAVAAAQTLAKAGGYKGAGSAEAATAAGSSAAAGGNTESAAAAASGVVPAPPILLPPRLRTQLALDLTRVLAEGGQLPRARELLKSLRAQPVVQSDPAQVAAAQAADLEVRAWALHATPAGALRPAVEKLLADAAALPDPAARARALMQLGVIAARSPLLKPQAARLFLTRSADALKAVEGPPQAALLGDWTVAFGEVLLAEAVAHAKAGQWSQASAVARQLPPLLEQATDHRAAARLHAIDFHLKSLTGGDQPQAALAAAVAAAQKENGLAERASLLRSVAALSGAAMDARLSAAVDEARAAALARPGDERARALTGLALLYADAGLRGRAGEMTQLSLDTPGLTAAQASELHAELLLRGDLATARALHGLGLYAESEAVLRRLGALLL